MCYYIYRHFEQGIINIVCILNNNTSSHVFPQMSQRNSYAGVVHSWKSWIICLTEVIFLEYQSDFRYRASPNSRCMSGTWMKNLRSEQFPFLFIYLSLFFIGRKKGLQNKEMSTLVTARTKQHLFLFSPHSEMIQKRSSKPKYEYSGNSQYKVTFYSCFFPKFGHGWQPIPFVDYFGTLQNASVLV